MQSQEDTTSELSTQVEELSKEVTQLKGINSFLRIECEDLKVRNTELQKKEKQVYTYVCIYVHMYLTYTVHICYINKL